MNQMGDLKEIIMFKVYEKWQQNAGIDFFVIFVMMGMIRDGNWFTWLKIVAWNCRWVCEVQYQHYYIFSGFKMI
jgi:hypothetical protein